MDFCEKVIKRVPRIDTSEESTGFASFLAKTTPFSGLVAVDVPSCYSASKRAGSVSLGIGECMKPDLFIPHTAPVSN